MKALCLEYFPGHPFRKGQVYEFTIKIDGRSRYFVIDKRTIYSTSFFTFFKVIEGSAKITHSEFKEVMVNNFRWYGLGYPQTWRGLNMTLGEKGVYVTLETQIHIGKDLVDVTINGSTRKNLTYEETLEWIRKDAPSVCKR